MHCDELRSAPGQFDVELGEADVVAQGQTDINRSGVAVDADDNGFVPWRDGVRLGEAERVVEVDLVVVRLDTGARRDQRVGHPAVVGGDEHARDDDDARALGDRAYGRRARPVKRFGDRRERHPEPAHRRLREQHQAGAGIGGAAGVLLDQAEVGRGFRAALDLCEGNPHDAQTSRGATVDHGTESTPSRIRRRGGSTGNPSTRSRSSIARHRTRGPNTPWPATLAHALSAAVSSAWMGWPATRWWISTLGSRSARSDGRSIANGSHASVRLIGPSASSSTPQQRRPTSSQVPSTISPPGASAARITDHASGTASAWYWRNTLNARTKTGLRPANSKPPSPNSTPSCGGTTRSGRISRPTTPTSARTTRSRAAISSVVTGSAP